MGRAGRDPSAARGKGERGRDRRSGEPLAAGCGSLYSGHAEAVRLLLLLPVDGVTETLEAGLPLIPRRALEPRKMASADLDDDVRSFLSDLQFEGQLEASISSALREQDIYSMDDLRRLSKDDMKEMGITIGPRNKIWNKLQAPLPLTDRPCQAAVVSGAPCTQASVLDTPAASICHGVSDLCLASHASFVESDGADLPLTLSVAPDDRPDESLSYSASSLLTGHGAAAQSEGASSAKACAMEAPADPKASVAPPSPCVGTAIAGPCVDVPMTSPRPDPNDSEATPGEAASEPTAKASRELFATREDVQVFARVRPHLSSEDASHSFVAVAEGSVSVSGAGGRCHSSKVDRAFPQGTTQHEVFGHIVPLIDSVLAGFNASVIAYGQTGSGIPLDLTRTRHTPGMSLALNMHALFM